MIFNYLFQNFRKVFQTEMYFQPTSKKTGLIRLLFAEEMKVNNFFFHPLRLNNLSRLEIRKGICDNDVCDLTLNYCLCKLYYWSVE